MIVLAAGGADRRAYLGCDPGARMSLRLVYRRTSHVLRALRIRII